MRAPLLLVLAACGPASGDVEGHSAERPVDSDDTDAGPACPSFADGVAAGTLASDAVTEASGIVASRAHPGTWWVHDDSGATARVHAVGDGGADLGSTEVTGATALDWEDVALAADGDGWTLLFGDIGDNGRSRDAIVLWRLPEPTPGDAASAPAERLALTYPDGPHDAETLLADPVSGDVLVVTKSLDGSRLYRAAAPLADGVVLEDVGVALPFGSEALPGDPLATGGDVAPDGALVLIRTYTAAWAWRRGPGQTVAEALIDAPCPVPLQPELQGEAIGWRADGAGYATVAEGAHPTLWTFAAER